MKSIALVLLFASFAFAEDPSIARAIEGAQLLHSAMRDPDSFKIGKIWIMRNDKLGDSACYQFHARNGFGGMNASHGVFTVKNKRALEHSNYKMTIDDPTDDARPNPMFEDRCLVSKHNSIVKDVTGDIQNALASAGDPK
jgi:hypothetical protein